MSKKAIIKRGGKNTGTMVPEVSDHTWQQVSTTDDPSMAMALLLKRTEALAKIEAKLQSCKEECNSAMEKFAKSLPLGCAVRESGGDVAPKESTADTKKADSTDAKKADAPAPVSGDPVEVIPGVPLDGLVKVGYFYVKYKNGRPVGIASSEEISEIES